MARAKIRPRVVVLAIYRGQQAAVMARHVRQCTQAGWVGYARLHRGPFKGCFSAPSSIEAGKTRFFRLQENCVIEFWRG